MDETTTYVLATIVVFFVAASIALLIKGITQGITFYKKTKQMNQLADDGDYESANKIADEVLEMYSFPFISFFKKK